MKKTKLKTKFLSDLFKERKNSLKVEEKKIKTKKKCFQIKKNK